MESNNQNLLKELEEVTKERKEIFEFISNEHNVEFTSLPEESQQALRLKWMQLRENEIYLKKKLRKEGLID